MVAIMNMNNSNKNKLFKQKQSPRLGYLYEFLAFKGIAHAFKT